MPEEFEYKECASMLTGIGLNSVPCWIRPVKTLSSGQKARAEAVRTALIGVGIKPDNMTAEGFGESKLICTEQSNDCFQKNRRVEIRWKKE